MKAAELVIFGLVAGGVHVAALAGLPLTATQPTPSITVNPVPIAVSAGSSDLQEMIARWQQKPVISDTPVLAVLPADEATLKLPQDVSVKPSFRPDLPTPKASLGPLPGFDPAPPRPDVSSQTAPAALAMPSPLPNHDTQASRIDTAPNLRNQPTMQVPAGFGALPNVSAPKPPGPALSSQAPTLAGQNPLSVDLQARLPRFAAPKSPQVTSMMPAPLTRAGDLPQIGAPIALPRPQIQAPPTFAASDMASAAPLALKSPRVPETPALSRLAPPGLSPTAGSGALPQVDAANPTPLPKPKPPKTFDNVSAQAPAVSLRPQIRPFVGSASAFAPTSTTVRPLARPASLKIPTKPTAADPAVKAPSTTPDTTPKPNRAEAQKSWAQAIAAAAMRNHNPKKGVHPAGAVRLTVTVSGSGQLISVRVTNSSGTRALDGKALASIRATTFPAAPAGMNGASAAFNIRLEFR